MAIAPRSRLPLTSPGRLPPGRFGASFGTWFAIAALLLVNGAFVVNNLAPYLGLNYAGAMTMYSGLVGGGDNHLFMSKLSLSDAYAYVSVVRVSARGRARETPALELFEDLTTPDGQPRPLVQLDLVRYHASRACASAPSSSLALTLLTETGRRLELENVCAEPSMLRYAVLSSYPRCKNRWCVRVLQRWQGSGASIE